MAIRTFFVATLSLSLAFAAKVSEADTIAWWHFDECAPGTTAPANTVASDQAPTTYAHVYTVGDAISMAGLVENGGDYLPTYTKPFRGLAVYDPVSGNVHTNRAAMKFRVERGGSSPDASAGRAYYGGALRFDGGKQLYQPLYGTSAITIEAFVCTTGGTYNLFAPIVGSVSAGSSLTSERWALYMRDDGTIAVRFTTNAGTTIWHEGDNQGTAKVNDGAWHHVAFTYDGEYARIYVDYVLDKNSKGQDRVFGKSGTIPTYSDDNITWIGGYPYEDKSYGSRKYPGVIDEVRVSSATLTSDQFLRMQPLDGDPDVLAYVTFDPEERNEYDSGLSNGVDLSCCTRQRAYFKSVSGANDSRFDTETKVGAVLAGKAETGHWIENAASFYQETNGVGKANFIQMPAASSRIRGNDGTNASYTVEMFFKTRGQVRGSANQRQVLMKLGQGSGYFNVLFRGDAYLFYVSGMANTNYFDSVTMNADDGKWHHVAVVVDGAAQKVSFYFDYRHEASRTGALPDIGSATSITFGAKEGGEGQWFDGWMDGIRVTRRALSPSEFLTTHPLGEGGTSQLALFERNYDLVCMSNAAMYAVGYGEARTGGSEPTFVRESRGALALDGADGFKRADNEWSVRLDSSRVVFPSVNLFEAEAYTVEFFAKFDGIVDENGAVPADSTTLAQHVPIMRLVRSDKPTDYDWYFYRAKDNAARVQLAVGGKYPYWTIPSGPFVDGKWHHYALTFEPVNDGTNTLIKLFYDYENVPHEKGGAPEPGVTLGSRLSKYVVGHDLMLGEGSNDQPNIVGEFDAIRVTKGVLVPSQFFARYRRGMVLFFR